MVGFDDILLADVVQPGLTVSPRTRTRLGRSAAELLFSRLDGYEGPSRLIVIPTRLIERGSGELQRHGITDLQRFASGGDHTLVCKRLSTGIR